MSRALKDNGGERINTILKGINCGHTFSPACNFSHVSLFVTHVQHCGIYRFAAKEHRMEFTLFSNPFSEFRVKTILLLLDES